MRIQIISGIAAVLLAGAGCNSRRAQETPDNTARNSDPSALTRPTADQGAQEGDDLKLTQRIRQAYVAADGLSMNAKNAKIIVDQGEATLLGPVASAAEKTRLVDLAANAGALRVVDKLEVISETATR